MTLSSVPIQVGLFSVGGDYTAIPLIQPRAADIHRLMTTEELTDLVTIAEVTPGPTSVSSSTSVGVQLAGPIGTILRILGCIIPSFIICLALAHLHYEYRGLSGVQTVLTSLRPVVVVLIGSAGVLTLMLVLFNSDIFSVSLANIHWVELVLFLGCLFILRKWKVGAISIILGSGLVGILACLVF